MPDRRIQRTRDLLRRALMQLINEKGYDAVTIQDIADRANLGRTTFYLHYESKEALLLDHHADFASGLALRPLSYEALMSDSAPPEFERFLKELADGRAIYLAIMGSRQGKLIRRGIHRQMMDSLLASLQAAFPDVDPTFPPDMLAHYIVGAQLAFIDRWLDQRMAYEVADVARMLHRLQRAAVCDAYDVSL